MELGDLHQLAHLTAEVLTEAISDACAMAKAASSRLKNPIKLAQTKAVEDHVQIKSKKKPSEISIEDKIKTASATTQIALKVG